MGHLNEQPGTRAVIGSVEHREHNRVRTLKGAKIIFNGGRSVIDCMVRNASSGGACVEVANLAGIPDRFALLILPAERHQECRVAWKRGNRVGVAFVA